PRAKRNTTIWKRSSRPGPPSACRPSPWRATPTARRTLRRAPTPRSSRANIRTGTSPAGSVTICRRRPRRRLPKRSSTSAPKVDRRERVKIDMEDRAIRTALQRHWAASDANEFVVEHEIYREDALLHYPQSGERIRGRDKIQQSRTVQPSK